MKLHVTESYLLLLWTEYVLAFGNLHLLHRQLLKARVSTSPPVPHAGAEELCHMMDLACVFYPKKVLCLQRSAATTLLLRKYGIRAEMVIGVQMLPFKSHAWVEVDSVIVNDKPYMREIYKVLERC